MNASLPNTTNNNNAKYKKEHQREEREFCCGRGDYSSSTIDIILHGTSQAPGPSRVGSNDMDLKEMQYLIGSSQRVFVLHCSNE